jgi:hypothetical protein
LANVVDGNGKFVIHAKGGCAMFWWIAAVAAVVVLIPFKLKFLRWWEARKQKEQLSEHGKWGDDA